MRTQYRHSGACPDNHMVIAALGCNLAWGIIDAGMYLMARLGERGRNFLMAKGIREAPDPKSAHSIIANRLPKGGVGHFLRAPLVQCKPELGNESGAAPVRHQTLRV